jgi:glucan endo-1,3-alpha-glucosidase
MHLQFLTLNFGCISDALALNIGSDDWEKTQVASAYAAAKSLGTGFKLFLSFDFTSLDCNLGDLVSRVNTYANHPNQFKVDGKPMISSYSGACLGNSGWSSLKAQTNGYLMPFIPGLEGAFPQWSALDSWFWLV